LLHSILYQGFKADLRGALRGRSGMKMPYPRRASPAAC
jgi:hypothetical protein